MRLWRRLVRLARRRRFEEELAEEVRFHREMAAAAGRRFGSEALALEDSRAVWRWAWLESLAQDIRYALRSFRKSPGFAFTVVGTLALGLGALGAGLSVFNAFVLRPFAVRDPYSLYRVVLWDKGLLTWREFVRFREEQSVFSSVAAFDSRYAMIVGRRTEVAVVSGNYFGMLGARVCLGRPILAGDDAPGTAVAVMAHDIWKNRWGSDPHVIGRKAFLNKQSVEIVGVACPEFRGLDITGTDYWVSLGLSGALAGGADLFGARQPAILGVMGRLKPGVEPGSAQIALAPFGRVWLMSRATPAGGATMREILTIFSTLAIAFGTVLLIACANVSNMMLARGLSRQREIALRMSLGAGRGRVVRQLLTEGLLLSIAAVPAAYGVADAAIRMAIWAAFLMAPPHVARNWRTVDLAPDWRVLALLLAVAGVMTLAFAAVPAFRATSPNALRARRSRLRNALVVVQVTVCVCLLIGLGVMLCDERRISSHDPGWDGRGMFEVLAPRAESRPLIGAQLRGEPAVAAAGVGYSTGGRLVDAAGGRNGVTLRFRQVSPGFFDVYRVPLLRGRNFTEAEAQAGAPVAILSESAARKLWPAGEALGRTMQLREDRSLGPGFRSALVVGIARDATWAWGQNMKPVTEYFYYPTGLTAREVVWYAARPRGNAGFRELEVAVARAAPGSAYEIRPMTGAFSEQLFTIRIWAGIALFLGGLALLLTLAGIYGVTSFVVSQRTREFGIRIALGAEPGDITGLVLRQSLRLAVAGAALGALLALGGARLTQHFFDTIRLFDPLAYVGAIAIAAIAAVAASYAPARRAARTDPAVSLRCD